MRKQAQVIKHNKHKRDKRRRAGNDLFKELEEAEVQQADRYDVYAKQTEILKCLFTLYLRVITNPSSYRENNLKCEEIVIQALFAITKIVHLVGQEYVVALVNNLNKIIEEQVLSLSVSFQIISCANASLLCAGNIISYDGTVFTKLMLRLLYEIEDRHVLETTRCLHHLFLKRHCLDVNIVAEVCIAISSVSMRLSPHSCFALLSTQRMILGRYPACKEKVLGNPKAISIADSIIEPIIPVNNGTASLPFSRPAWELGLIANSYFHPNIAKFCVKTCNGSDRVETNEMPHKLFELNEPIDGEVSVFCFYKVSY